MNRKQIFMAVSVLVGRLLNGEGRCASIIKFAKISLPALARFFRIHRSTLVNLAHVQELHAWLGGGVLLRLKDQNRTELQVARERVAAMKDKLGLT